MTQTMEKKFGLLINNQIKGDKKMKTTKTKITLTQHSIILTATEFYTIRDFLKTIYNIYTAAECPELKIMTINDLVDFIENDTPLELPQHTITYDLEDF